ncbi:MAG: hypothetical protein ACD_46C00507G0002 [uncultured bacterium]|nr:MAG: hypothetical protein ACD_46C00507G0002 [uncultured bacterium]
MPDKLTFSIDHIVLTTQDVEKISQFYHRVLGMDIVTFGVHGERKALFFGKQKINLHQYQHEFEPKAANPTPGTLDFCLITKTPLEKIIKRLRENNVAIKEGPVTRTGALGPIHSIYFHDPDGNLIEISNTKTHQLNERNI